MKNIETIAIVCRKARIRNGDGQRVIAEYGGYDTSTVCKFEKGKINNAELFMVYLALYPDIVKELPMPQRTAS